MALFFRIKLIRTNKTANIPPVIIAWKCIRNDIVAEVVKSTPEKVCPADNPASNVPRLPKPFTGNRLPKMAPRDGRMVCFKVRVDLKPQNSR